MFLIDKDELILILYKRDGIYIYIYILQAPSTKHQAQLIQYLYAMHK